MIVNYAKKYEECNNYGYYKEFFEENYEAADIIRKCEAIARELYGDFKSAISERNKVDLMERLREKDLLKRLSPDVIKEIENFANMPNDFAHPFRCIGLSYELTSEHQFAPENRFNIYGLLKVKERSKADLFSDTHLYILNGNNGNGMYAHIDISRLIGVGVDIRKSFIYENYMGHHTNTDRETRYNKFSSEFRFSSEESGSKTAWFDIEIEYNALLLRIITNKMVSGDIQIFTEAITNVILDKMIRLQITLYTYAVYLYGNRDVISNNLETFVKLTFLFKLVYNSTNGVDTDDIGDSIKKLMRDFNYCTHNRGAFDSVFMTADLWRSKLIKGYQDLPSFSDNAINEVLEMYQKKRHAIITINKTNRPVFANKIITGIQLVSTESLQDDILNEFNFKNAYSTFKNSPAMSSTVGMESISNKREFMITRSKLLAKLKHKDRETYIGLENDLMKIKSDAMNCKTTDGMKILMNKVNTLGSIIAVEMDTNDTFFAEALALLDAQRIMLADMMASRSIIHENSSVLYGMVKMNGKII